MAFNFLTYENILKLPEDEKIISYKNKSYSDFKDWSDRHNIEVVTEYEYSDEIPKGNIIRLDVIEGTMEADRIKKIDEEVSSSSSSS